MGYEHVAEVKESTRYRGSKKAVVEALAHHINTERSKDGDCKVWPGVERLMVVAGLSRSTVQRRLDELIAEENPVVELLKLGSGRESSEYFIHMDRLGERQTDTGVPGTRQGYQEATSGVSERGEGVSERHPKRRIGIGNGITEENAGKSLSLSSGVDSLLEPDKPKTNPQTSGTTVPEPQSGTSRPETHGDFVPQERPPVPPSPRKAEPVDIWTVWTKEARKAYFELWPEAERKAYQLETLFAVHNPDKTSKAADFQRLLDGGADAKVVAKVMAWAAEQSKGHWQFHNSKHFCKDSVYPVVEQQYLAWNKKKSRAKKAAA
jgi:hypothetical protein